MSMADLGKLLIVVGAVIVVVGVVVLLGGKIPWLGRLPGDITIRRNGAVFYFPLATSLLISVIVSVLFSLFRR